MFAKKRWIFVAVLFFFLRPPFSSLYFECTPIKFVLFFYALTIRPRLGKRHDLISWKFFHLICVSTLKGPTNNLFTNARIYKLTSLALISKRMNICGAFKFQTSGLFCLFFRNDIPDSSLFSLQNYFKTHATITLDCWLYITFD